MFKLSTQVTEFIGIQDIDNKTDWEFLHVILTTVLDKLQLRPKITQC